MNFKTFSVLLLASLLGTAAIAGDKHRTRVEIVIDDDASGHQTFLFDSQDAGFDLHSMTVGEARALTDASGNIADVRRTDDGFEFDINGTTIDLEDLHEIDGLLGEHDINIQIDDIDSDVVVVKDIKKVKMIKTDDADGVLFIDGSEFDVDSNAQAHGDHEVRIIRKKVDVTN